MKYPHRTKKRSFGRGKLRWTSSTNVNVAHFAVPKGALNLGVGAHNDYAEVG